MLTRRYGVALGIAIALLALAPTPIQSAPAADAGPEASSDTSGTWLQLHWGGTVPTISDDLTVDRDGRVRVRLESGERGDRVGLFGFTLSPQRLAQLRQAVGKANLLALQDEYPLGDDQTEVEWVILVIDDPELGHKQVKASNRSWVYPLALRSLFRLECYPPTGVLGQLITEAVQTPIAATRFSVTVSKRYLRKGEAISVAVVVTNIGKEPVVLGGLESTRIVGGHIEVFLQNAEHRVVGDAFTLTVGSLGGLSPAPFDDEAKADLARVVRLAPGQQWRIALLKPLIAPEVVGPYTVWASVWMFRQYDLPVLTRELGEGFVSGWVYAKPVQITVSR